MKLKALLTEEKMMYFAFKVGNILGNSPWYDFKNHSIDQSKWYKFIKIIWSVGYLAILIIISFAYTNRVFIQANAIMSKLTAKQIFTILQIILSSLSISIFVFDMWLKESVWHQFLVCYEYLSKQLRESHNCQHNNSLNIIVIVFLVLYVTITFLSLNYILLKCNFGNAVFAITNLFALFSFATNGFIICIFTFSLKCRYRELNCLLRDTLTRVQKPITPKALDEYMRALEIRKLGKMYKDLQHIVDIFGSLTSWKLLVILLIAFFDIIEQIQFFVNDINNVSIARCLYVSWIIVLTLSIIISCDGVIVESKKIIPLCHELCDRRPIYEMEKTELKILAKMAESCSPVFTAGRLLEVDRTTIISFVTTATTYLIVLIQLGNAAVLHKFKH